MSKRISHNAPLYVSQNFITSRRTVERIVKLAHFNNDEHVIEIGPGKGHITRVLVKYCKKLTAVELDSRLYEKLTISMKSIENLRLIRGDFLHMTLPAGSAYMIFANIPFNRTTDIVRKITETSNPPADAWLIMEKGAAKRFAGLPRENSQSLLLKPYFELEIVYYFKRSDFHPMPSVDAVMLHMKRKPQPDLTFRQRDAFAAFVHKCMTGTRSRRQLLTDGQMADALRRNGLPVIAPGGEMLYVQWLCLFQQVSSVKRRR